MIIMFFSFWFVRLDADGFAIRLVVLFLFCSFSSLFPSVSSRILAKSKLASKATESRDKSCPHYSVTTMVNLAHKI